MLKMASVIILVLSVWALALTNPALAKEDAIETLKKAAETDPKDYAPHFGLGQAYYTMGLYDKAIAEYKFVYSALISMACSNVLFMLFKLSCGSPNM